MGLRAILLLLVAVGGLAAVLLLTDQKRAAKDTAELPVLDGRSLRESHRIWWQFEGRPPVEVARTADGGFGLTEPVVDRASPAYLKQICDAWDSAQMRATPLADDAEGRQKAGLEPPEMRLLVEFPEGGRIEVDVGAPGPLGTTRFLRRDGKIWEGGEALLESFRVGVDDLRDHRVFQNTPATLRELRVEQLSATGQREALHLEQVGDDWQLRSPIEGRADNAGAMRFATAVLSLRVDDFVYGSVRMPTTEPDIVVFARGVQLEETARLWMDRGQLYGQLPGRDVVFTSDNRQYGAIFQNAAEQLRARILVPLANVYQQLGDVVVDPGQGRGERLRLLRDDATGEWRLVEPVEHPAAATPCNETVQAINNLHAVEFVVAPEGAPIVVGDPRYGLGPGRLQVSVRADERQSIELWFGDEVKKNDLDLVYACRADEPKTVVMVPKIPVDHLRRAWIDYCDRALMRLGVEAGRIDVAGRNGQRRSYYRADGHWQQDGQDGRFDAIGSFVNDVLRDSNGSRAVDVRGDKLGAADWTLTLMRNRDGDELARLRVWDRGDDVPLVVQNGDDGPVGYELVASHDKQLRDLWR